MTALPLEILQKEIAKSQFGQECIQDPLLMTEDVWSLRKLGYSEEECQINGKTYLHFKDFSLPWLKLLAKLTTKAGVRERHSLSQVYIRVNCLKHLDEFLVSNGHNQPQTLTDPLLQQFIAHNNSNNRQATLAYATKLWTEEQWLKLPYIKRKYKQATPKIETIPEEVLYQVYEKFDLFPPLLERLFRLQLVLGCRIGEILIMPRQCLKQEGDQWFLLRWVEKRKHWQFSQIHSLVAELVQEQQRFLDAQFGQASSFDKLFCKLSTQFKGGTEGKRRFVVEPLYIPKIASNAMICRWLRDFSETAALRDKYSNRFYLTSHMFRRTKASIMAHCEVEDEYIAAVLGHGSLDMLPHYRQRSLERLEKEATAKGYVDRYGRVTALKPKKQRYERLNDLLKVTTPLGGKSARLSFAAT